MRWKLVTAATVMAVSLVMLAGCGGGGSGGPGDAGGAGGAVGTGLIPGAPALGASLYADATTLQPLRPGAVWHYRGSSPSGASGSYGVLVRHAAGSGGAVTSQRDSTAPDDNGSMSLTTAGGTISAEEDLQLPNGGSAGTFSYLMLRSPVRQADQITLIDQAATASGVDIDSDGVNDVADVAAYSRVIGNEAVELPDLQKTLTALRVDNTVLVRFKLSSNGQVLPAVGFVQSDWYAPGIGIVRRASTEPTVGNTSTAISTDERLVYWDGLTEGVGALPPVSVRPASTGVPLNLPWSAVAVGERLLVATTVQSGALPSASDGLVLSALDRNGVVMASRNYTDLRPDPIPVPLQLLAGGVAFVNTQTMAPGSPFVNYEVRMRRFDGNAAVVSAAAGTVLVDSLWVNTIAAASDGQKLWLMWVESTSNNSGSNRLWLRDFDSNGQPVGAPQLLDSADFLGGVGALHSRLTISAKPGRVLASWALGSFPGSPAPTMKYALVLGLGAAQVRTLGTVTGPNSSPLTPVVSASRQSLVWPGLLGFAGFTNSDDGLMRGIAIGDDAVPIRSAAASLDAEVLAALPGTVASVGSSTGASTLTNAVAFADGGSFKAAASRDGFMLPAIDIFSSIFLEIDEWGTAGALASTAPTVQLRRLDWIGFYRDTRFGSLRLVVPFDDHLMALGYDEGRGLSAVTVYRR